MDSDSPKSAQSWDALTATGLSASLTATDLQGSVGWYRETLGWTLDHEFTRDGVAFAARMRAGDVVILLTQDDGAKGADREKGAGISLRLTTRQEADKLAARARAHGAVLDSEPVDGHGARFFRLSDPDGFRWTIWSEI
jgi:uncharacterized glyoxalase superfamily protein PhnB